jgi:hypothetical protein
MIRSRFPDLEIKPEEFEITVWSNKKEVVVKYRRLIRYVVKDSNLYYDISVNIVSGEIAPFDGILYSGNFFIPTENQKKVIGYLKERLNLPLPNMDNEVSENDENYYVSATSNTAFIHLIVNKKTGRQTEPLQGTYHVAPKGISPSIETEDDPLTEIKK